MKLPSNHLGFWVTDYDAPCGYIKGFLPPKRKRIKREWSPKDKGKYCKHGHASFRHEGQSRGCCGNCPTPKKRQRASFKPPTYKVIRKRRATSEKLNGPEPSRSAQAYAVRKWRKEHKRNMSIKDWISLAWRVCMSKISKKPTRYSMGGQ